VEIWSTDDDTLMDLSDVVEIVLELRDPATMFPELTLRMSSGDITIPSQGIIQWRAEVGAMGMLDSKLYEAIMLLETSSDTVPLFLGSISIVE
jgi:hypothetical protein